MICSQLDISKKPIPLALPYQNISILTSFFQTKSLNVNSNEETEFINSTNLNVEQKTPVTKKDMKDDKGKRRVQKPKRFLEDDEVRFYFNQLLTGLYICMYLAATKPFLINLFIQMVPTLHVAPRSTTKMPD
jgi:hypothetical protein